MNQDKHIGEENCTLKKQDGTTPEPPPQKEVLFPKKEKSNSAKYDARVVTIGAGAVLVLLLLAFSGISRRSAPQQLTRNESRPQQPATKEAEAGSASEPSITPIMEVGQAALDSNLDRLEPEEFAHRATQPLKPRPSAMTLAEIPPFENTTLWQAPPYQSVPVSSGGSEVLATREPNKGERDSLDTSSLVFVRNSEHIKKLPEASPEPNFEIGLPPGARLRARLESAVSTAVATPVVAVVEYNYEENDEIVVPAGSRVFGHIESADDAGYLGIRFESLTLPSGSSLRVEASAADLRLRPLRGKVQGKNSGKNFLVRSLAGIGQIGATFLGRGSLNQPFSESDLLRERLSNNIGQTGDQALANVVRSERLVISIPADTEIYVIFEKAAREKRPIGPVEQSTQMANQPSIEQLRQLLELQRELNDGAVLSPAQ